MFAFENTYARDLPGLYAPATPRTPAEPRLVLLNASLAEELGLDPATLQERGAAWLSGAEVPDGAEPIAQAYAGHQFGHLNPHMGDGRAVLLGELVDRHGHRRDVQLKGSGRTPFSRGGDGKAALGPMLREYLMGEAMHGLGIPTTRALAVVATGEPVYRDTLLPGAVLTRVASSHLRVGTFEFFAIRQDQERLTRLLDYTIRRHVPEAVDAPDPAVALFRSVRDATAKLVAQWMAVGFIHGVLNTDNTALSGETIDYGPCAFLDAHIPSTVFSSIDRGGRYAYGNQPGILHWNLSRFARALLPLVDADPQTAADTLQPIFDAFPDVYAAERLAVMRPKLGLQRADPMDESLVDALDTVMEEARADHTLTLRHLSDHLRGTPDRVEHILRDSPGAPEWLRIWRDRVAADTDLPPDERAAAMDAVNPLYIPRNHKVEEALSAASDQGDLGPIRTLLELFADPYTPQPDREDYSLPAPPAFTSCYQTFCGT